MKRSIVLLPTVLFQGCGGAIIVALEEDEAVNADGKAARRFMSRYNR